MPEENETGGIVKLQTSFDPQPSDAERDRRKAMIAANIIDHTDRLTADGFFLFWDLLAGWDRAEREKITATNDGKRPPKRGD